MEEINLNLSEIKEIKEPSVSKDSGMKLDLGTEPKTNNNNNFNSQPSVDFGGGLDLLMNEKVKEKKGSSSNKEEIDTLENDLKELENLDMNGNGSLSINDSGLKISEDTLNLNETSAVTNTWDNYSKLNNASESNVDEKPLTKEDMLKEKFNILRKLETFERKGIQLTKKYSMESSLNEMKGEYENIVAEKERKNSVKFQGKVLTALITGIEFLNGKFDPFDIKLDGWSEQINENLEDYDEIFTELFEKYRSKTTMSPEIKLIFQLAASGMMIHMTNTMFKSAMPGMDDIMRQNPDLMQQFTNAAMNNMNQTNPGVSNFMNEFSSNKPSGSNFMRQNPPVPPSPKQNIQVPQQNPVRKEMNGPSNLGDLLSGIKKKPRQSDEQSINNSSVVSLEDLNELEKTIPKSNKNKKKIKNTISLDI